MDLARGIQEILASARGLQKCLAAKTGQADLADSEWLVLWSLCEWGAEGVSQNELAARLEISPARVSDLVERLRRRGLVEGHRAANDRRKQIWKTTGDGRRANESALAELDAWAHRLRNAASKAQLAAIAALLSEVRRAADGPDLRLVGPGEATVRGGAA